MKSKILAITLAAPSLCIAQTADRPNVIIIITDDQGFGDLSFYGNPHVKTPVIDQFARESVRLNNFYVCPVSAPTRSSLMTGRYSLRTGIRDTYNGGAIMSTEEITIAEVLRKEGYKTGIFGKWHLGDNYPSRPIDQGFDEALVHLGGGMGQVGDITTWFRGDSSYFDPVLWHNGSEEKHYGYCSDIFAGEAVRFIEENRKSPFFCYLAFNTPHTPLQVPGRYYDMYKDIDPASGFEKDGRPFPKMSEQDKDDARRVYAMVTNIDDNVGRILKTLDNLKLSRNTLVIFMTDNGPQQRRYIAGMRGLKGSVFRGGIRVPCFIRYPAQFKGNREIEMNASNIDILPTVAEICKADLPDDRIIDGKSILPLIRGNPAVWNERPLFFYWTRKYPELYNNTSLQKGKYKLVGHTDYDAEIKEFELYDIESDPYELNNIILNHTDMASELRDDLRKLFSDLVNSPNLINQPGAILGTENENPVFLTRNDADGERGIWAQEEIFGKWRVKFTEGNYNIRFRFLNPLKPNGQIVLETKPYINQKRNTEENVTEVIMNNIHYPDLECDLIPYYLVDSRSILPFWIEIEKIK